MQQEEALLDQLKDHSKADEAFVISASYILERTKLAHELFEGSQPVQKNRLLLFVFANATVNGEKLLPQLKTPFAGILLCNRNEVWLRRVCTFRTSEDLPNSERDSHKQATY